MGHLLEPLGTMFSLCENTGKVASFQGSPANSKKMEVLLFFSKPTLVLLNITLGHIFFTWINIMEFSRFFSNRTNEQNQKSHHVTMEFTWILVGLSSGNLT